MTDTTVQASPIAVPKPADRPADARFSSGPCKKFPGHSVDLLSGAMLGISHRGAARAKLQQALDRQRALLGCRTIGGSRLYQPVILARLKCAYGRRWVHDRGCSGLGEFSNDWAIDIVQQLKLKDARVQG